MNTPMRAVTEYVDARIGVTYRVLCDEQDRPFRLHADFETRRGRHAKLGDIYKARSVGEDPGGGGCFLDLGFGSPAYLRGPKTPPIGATEIVRVVSEARAEKGPVVTRASVSRELADQSLLGIVVRAKADPFLVGVEIVDRVEDERAREQVDDALLQAEAATYNLAGGGSVSIEPTRALTAIDIDAAGRIARGERSHFALTANLEATELIARMLSLKSMGGLIAIDLLKLKEREDKQRIEQALQDALAPLFGKRVEVGAVTRFGLLDATIPHGFTPIADVFQAVGDVERQSLALLDDLEQIGRHDRGARLELRLSPRIYQWMQDTSLDWKGELTNRLGGRFVVNEDPGLEPGQDCARTLS